MNGPNTKPSNYASTDVPTILLNERSMSNEFLIVSICAKVIKCKKQKGHISYESLKQAHCGKPPSSSLVDFVEWNCPIRHRC